MWVMRHFIFMCHSFVEIGIAVHTVMNAAVVLPYILTLNTPTRFSLMFILVSIKRIS